MNISKIITDVLFFLIAILILVENVLSINRVSKKMFWLNMITTILACAVVSMIITRWFGLW